MWILHHRDLCHWVLLIIAAWSQVACIDTPQRQHLSVFAASSFRDVLPVISQRCGIDVDFQFAGSHVLKLQVQHGAAADVFLSANQGHIDALHATGLMAKAEPLVRNSLTIALAPGREQHASHIETLLNSKRIVLGVRSSPIGAYTQEWLSTLFNNESTKTVKAINDQVISYESNTRIVLQRVLQGDADAGIVYQSDTHPFPSLRTHAIPRVQQPDIVMFMGASLSPTSNQSQVQTFRECVQGPGALAIFQQYGFESL